MAGYPKWLLPIVPAVVVVYLNYLDVGRRSDRVRDARELALPHRFEPLSRPDHARGRAPCVARLFERRLTTNESAT